MGGLRRGAIRPVRRFVPDRLPVFEHPDEGKRVLTARKVLLSLENSR